MNLDFALNAQFTSFVLFVLKSLMPSAISISISGVKYLYSSVQVRNSSIMTTLMYTSSQTQKVNDKARFSVHYLRKKLLINEASDLEDGTHEKTTNSSPTHLTACPSLPVRWNRILGRERPDRERGPRFCLYPFITNIVLPAHHPSPCSPPLSTSPSSPRSGIRFLPLKSRMGSNRMQAFDRAAPLPEGPLMEEQRGREQGQTVWVKWGNFTARSCAVGPLVCA